MLLGVRKHSDLTARISHWQEEVFTSISQQASTGQPRSKDHEPHHMKLRSQGTRPALAEISGNPYSKKRKAFPTIANAPPKKQAKKAVMDNSGEEVAPRPGPGRPRKNQKHDGDENEEVEQPVPRPRGRPAKNIKPVASREVTMPFRNDFPFPESSRRGSASPSKGSRPPGKKGQLTIYKPFSEAAINMRYLSRCDPAVNLTKIHTLIQDQSVLSATVVDLFDKLRDVPHGLIPSALEV